MLFGYAMGMSVQVGVGAVFQQDIKPLLHYLPIGRSNHTKYFVLEFRYRKICVDGSAISKAALDKSIWQKSHI